MVELNEFVTYLNIRTVLVCTIVFLFLKLTTSFYRGLGTNLPPGPRCWPIVGCIPELVWGLNKHPLHELFSSLSRKYGNVCSLATPFGRVVLVSGHDAVYETLTREEFNWRAPSRQDTEPLYGPGIILASGEPWKEHRKFSLTVLRGFGVGKRSFEDQVAFEAQCLMREFAAHHGEPFDPKNTICNAISNIICSVVFGKRFEYNDPEFLHLLYLLDEWLNQMPVELILKVAPFLSKIPFFPRGALPPFQEIRRKIQDIVNAHRDSYDKDDVRDFIDVYLRDTHAQTEELYLTDDSLCAVVHDLFLAGTETTSSTIRWAILYMLKYPDVQKRVQEELDAVVGRGRLPKLSDRSNLPYTDAVIQEVQRYGSIILMAGLRSTRDDIVFRGHTIPKGSTIISDMYSVTRDPGIWDDPDVFKPERFLDDDGKVNNIPEHIPFGVGKRACLGEQLARMELFIIYTHIMHRFNITKPTNTKSLNLRPKAGAVLTPYTYEICAVPRE